MEDFGSKLRDLRIKNGLTLRALADLAHVDFTYLSKMENGKAGYLPGVETIRDLAAALGVEALDLLRLANKMPPELALLAGSPNARRFYQRAQEITDPKDWDALLDFLEERRAMNAEPQKGGGT